MNFKRFFAIMICLALVFAVGGCASNEGTSKNTETTAKESVNKAPEKAEEGAAEQQNAGDKEANKIMVEIVMEDGSVMELELYPDIAPATVENFVKLTNEGFYNGLTFHRIISGFMIQGGDPEGTGFGGSKDTVKGEFASNGFKNDLSHKRGVISMARSQNPNSASSQFFICHADSEFLDGQYAAFGKMTSGFEVLDKLAQTPVEDSNGTVAKENQPVIKTITVK
ncbi:MAG: peptidylprolyl isomerase [Clostridia bacterium]|nr:peptidylprolyl isomerase [Clostridia bacterium]